LKNFPKLLEDDSILFSLNKEAMGSMCDPDYDPPCRTITLLGFETERGIFCDLQPELCTDFSPVPCSEGLGALSGETKCPEKYLFFCGEKKEGNKPPKPICRRIPDNISYRVSYCITRTCYESVDECKACSDCPCKEPVQGKCMVDHTACYDYASGEWDFTDHSDGGCVALPPTASIGVWEPTEDTDSCACMNYKSLASDCDPESSGPACEESFGDYENPPLPEGPPENCSVCTMIWQARSGPDHGDGNEWIVQAMDQECVNRDEVPPVDRLGIWRWIGPCLREYTLIIGNCTDYNDCPVYLGEDPPPPPDEEICNKFACDFSIVDGGAPTYTCSPDGSGQYISQVECEAGIASVLEGPAAFTKCPRPKYNCTLPGGLGSYEGSPDAFLCVPTSDGSELGDYDTLSSCEAAKSMRCGYRFKCSDDGQTCLPAGDSDSDDGDYDSWLDCLSAWTYAGNCTNDRHNCVAGKCVPDPNGTFLTRAVCEYEDNCVLLDPPEEPPEEPPDEGGGDGDDGDTTPPDGDGGDGGDTTPPDGEDVTSLLPCDPNSLCEEYIGQVADENVPPRCNNNGAGEDTVKFCCCYVAPGETTKRFANINYCLTRNEEYSC
jgi:hypothetical protein